MRDRAFITGRTVVHNSGFRLGLQSLFISGIWISTFAVLNTLLEVRPVHPINPIIL